MSKPYKVVYKRDSLTTWIANIQYLGCAQESFHIRFWQSMKNDLEDFEKDGRDTYPTGEYFLNNSLSLPCIKAAPFQGTLWSKRVDSCYGWAKVGDGSQLIETRNNSMKPPKRLYNSDNACKARAGKGVSHCTRRKPFGFQVGDSVIVKVVISEGVIRLEKLGKLKPQGKLGPIQDP
ncbi:hypothetical protein Tco_1084489 [Tanacetum coccineum]